MPSLSRISKLFIDRDSLSADEALERRRGFAVAFLCGPDIAASPTLQAALLTGANVASRCFPGTTEVALTMEVAETPLLLWPSLRQTLGSALTAIAGVKLVHAPNDIRATHNVVIGAGIAPPGAMRATFDGWIAKVGPASHVAPLPQRDYCPLAGVLAAALVCSELFAAFAELNIMSTRRTLALSLWRSEADINSDEALGPRIEYLPGAFWMLGLGHLGSAYLWALSILPYKNPAEVEIYLNDFDTVEEANFETGLLFHPDVLGRYKTRVCGDWLEARGFRTRLIERPFDRNFRRRTEEPALAFCGFDSNPPRRDLATAGFSRVVESGLGGTVNNFDTMSLHSLPNARTPLDLWPDLDPDEEIRLVAERERLAQENRGYQHLADDPCGRYELAGKSIAVPFVGAAAGCFVIAEALRLFHSGPAYADLKLSLSASDTRLIRSEQNYTPLDLPGLVAVNAARPPNSVRSAPGLPNLA